MIFSQPVVQARLGNEYRYDVRASRSLGDMRARVIAGKETMNYWDAEQLRFRIVQGPAWLRLDEQSGRLSGTPVRAGKYAVAVAVTLQREERRLDPAQLQWGIEKVIDMRLETVGTAQQAFVIDAAP